MDGEKEQNLCDGYVKINLNKQNNWTQNREYIPFKDDSSHQLSTFFLNASWKSPAIRAALMRVKF